MSRRRAAALLASVLVCGAVTGGTTAAQAVDISQLHGVNPAVITDDERVQGLWYTDRLKFDELSAKGATGEGIRIAVIDSAINLDAAELQGANITVKGSYCAFPEAGETVPAVSDDVARSGHGTDVVAMLVGNGTAADGGPGTRGIVPDAEVWFYAEGMPGEETNANHEGCEIYDPSTEEFYARGTPMGHVSNWLGGAGAYAAWHAIEQGADIIVYSAIGPDVSGWHPVGVSALRAGVPIVAGTPNPDGTMDHIGRSWPYGLNGAVSVSGVDNEGDLLHGGDGTDNINLRGEAIGARNLGFLSAGSALLTPSGKTEFEPSISYGTSLATPLVAGTIALGLQKYPDATANQVLQAMIRTTGNTGLHEPTWHGEQHGYGIANPSAMLEVDPTQYPDENPLFVTDVNDSRCVDTDGTVPSKFEHCAWTVTGPYAEEVWPAKQSAEQTTSPWEGEMAPWMPLVLTVGGVVLLGVVATAIVVPIVVSRSRKRSAQAPRQAPSDSDEYRR